MDFRMGETSESLRQEMRAFLGEHLTDDLEEQVYRTGVNHDDGFTAAMVANHWVAPAWPVEVGGRGLDPLELLAVSEELSLADAPVYGTGTTQMVASVIRAVGTDQQKADIVPRALAGEIIIVLGFTEPEVGSDVAAASTRAVRDGDQWVINGQKMFTTNAQIGDYVFLLTRTNVDQPKHRGLTMFLVPLDQPGVEIQAVFTLSGERTNIVYYNDVRVDDAWRIGGVDEGWTTMTVSLAAEHGAGFGSAIQRLLDASETWAREATDDEGRSRMEDPEVREALGRTAIDLEVSRLLQRKTAWMLTTGQTPTVEGPMSKLFSSEALKERARDLVELVGPDALRSYFDPTAPVHGVIEHLLRFSVGTTIYAGTSEIHRNMIAQRGLGLPRTR
jgi:3-oxocholest-4-en-26-oyl-CoA dehydrogenase alpha subunit